VKPQSRLPLILGFAAITALALLLRLPGRDMRPMHADESVHAIKLRDLFEKGDYVYDFNEFHGPTLYYASLPVLRLSGVRTFDQTTEAQLRLVTVLFGQGPATSVRRELAS